MSSCIALSLSMGTAMANAKPNSADLNQIFSSQGKESIAALSNNEMQATEGQLSSFAALLDSSGAIDGGGTDTAINNATFSRDLIGFLQALQALQGIGINLNNIATVPNVVGAGYYDDDRYEYRNGYYDDDRYEYRNGYYDDDRYEYINGYYDDDRYEYRNGYYDDDRYEYINGYYDDDRYEYRIVNTPGNNLFGQSINPIIGNPSNNTATVPTTIPTTVPNVVGIGYYDDDRYEYRNINIPNNDLLGQLFR